MELPTIYHALMVDGAKPVPLRSVDQAYGSEHSQTNCRPILWYKMKRRSGI